MFNVKQAALAFALVSAAIPASAVEIPVTVGGPGGTVAYSPNNVTANVGDVVVFTFQQKNHTLTESLSVTQPCSPKPNGRNSGFIPVAADQTTNFQTARLTVTNTDPIWFYCAQTGHCQQGMVFAVNPGDQLAAFQAAALASGGSSTAATVTSPAATGVQTVTATMTLGSQTITTTYGSFPGSAQPTSGSSTEHKIIVGGPNKLIYDPANITAQVGDIITFEFHQKNHTVTQSSFAIPCRKLADTSSNGQVGFNSGFQPVADNATTFPTFSITVNDTAPIWAYCAQSGHCGQGMVFSANAIESGPNTFSAFQAAAIKQNGTGAATTSTPSGNGNGAMAINFSRGAGVAASVVALAVGLLL